MIVDIPIKIDVGEVKSVTAESVESIVEAVIYHYIHNEFSKSDGWRTLKGADAIDRVIRDAISNEVKTIVACNLDKIVKKAITNTAISIRNNSKYGVVYEAVKDALNELDNQ